MVDKDSEYPNWSSMVDDAITRGSIGDLGSPFYIYGAKSGWVDGYGKTVIICVCSASKPGVLT